MRQVGSNNAFQTTAIVVRSIAATEGYHQDFRYLQDIHFKRCTKYENDILKTVLA